MSSGPKFAHSIISRRCGRAAAQPRAKRASAGTLETSLPPFPPPLADEGRKGRLARKAMAGPGRARGLCPPCRLVATPGVAWCGLGVARVAALRGGPNPGLAESFAAPALQAGGGLALRVP